MGWVCYLTFSLFLAMETPNSYGSDSETDKGCLGAQASGAFFSASSFEELKSWENSPSTLRLSFFQHKMEMIVPILPAS